MMQIGGNKEKKIDKEPIGLQVAAVRYSPPWPMFCSISSPSVAAAFIIGVSPLGLLGLDLDNGRRGPIAPDIFFFLDTFKSEQG